MQVVQWWSFIKERLALIGEHIAVVFKRVELVTDSSEILGGPCFKRWISQLGDSSGNLAQLVVSLRERCRFLIEPYQERFTIARRLLCSAKDRRLEIRGDVTVLLEDMTNSWPEFCRNGFVDRGVVVLIVIVASIQKRLLKGILNSFDRCSARFRIGECVD